jgi:hypothetical protein
MRGSASGCWLRSSESSAPRPRRQALLGSQRSRHWTGIRSTTRQRATGSPKHSAHFSTARVHHTGPAPASEDFGGFGTAWHVPSVFWFVGGTDPEIYAKAKAAGTLNKLPVNHSPQFAPVIHPTLETGVETLVVAVLAWLAP